MNLLREANRIVTSAVVIDCSDASETIIGICTLNFQHNPRRAESDFVRAKAHLDDLPTASSESDELLERRPVRDLYVYDDDNTRTTLGAFTPEGRYST